MDLEKLFHEVNAAVSGLDFKSIWPGFRPLRFALYDSETCIFDGRRIEKTDAFTANTSIEYNGEQIAIWMVQDEPEIPVLASKIVHEMFHGFQTKQGWDCWPNEMEALYTYKYDAENLCLKLRENALLLSLLDSFDAGAYGELLAIRKLRSVKFPNEYSCEIKFEEIEGTANYIEWQALRQLDRKKADALTDHMRSVMTKPEFLFPIRISSYYTGALMISAMLAAGDYSFEPASRPAIIPILETVAPFSGEFKGEEELRRTVSDAVDAFYGDTEAIIRAALEKNEIVLKGPAELKFVNIYNARCSGGFITSTYFLMYSDEGQDKILQGNFVIRMADEKTIDTVYRWE